MAPGNPGTTLVLFNHTFDRMAHAELADAWPQIQGGFDLFAFPSRLRLLGFDLERFARWQAVKARALGARAVVSHDDPFGALAAALVAERMGWPGTPVSAVLACQHKAWARSIMADAVPEATVPFARWDPSSPPPLPFPCFVKPIKAAFSILAREVADPQALRAATRFRWSEALVLHALARPFDRVCANRLPQAGPSRRFLLEATVRAPQFTLDGYVFEGEMRHLGVVDSVMYPGTQAFMRFDYPSRLPRSVQFRAAEVARRFLEAVGFSHGAFNMEFFYDPATDRLSIIEVNPRLASQFSDLYRRVDGVNLHEVALALAHGRDPALLPRAASIARVASSFVFRSFDPRRGLAQPGAAQVALLRAAYPDALFIDYAPSEAERQRDLRWLGSCRHGILHLGGRDADDLRRHCEVASGLLGWPAPYGREDLRLFHPSKEMI